MAFNIQLDCDNILNTIKRQSWFPYKSGNLKFQATSGKLLSPELYVIHFDSTIAPYVEALEEGSGPHNIPGAFGKPIPFGTFGRFDGKFHPGSEKHKGFIKDKCISEIVNYFTVKYRGAVVEVSK